MPPSLDAARAPRRSRRPRREGRAVGKSGTSEDVASIVHPHPVEDRRPRLSRIVRGTGERAYPPLDLLRQVTWQSRRRKQIGEHAPTLVAVRPRVPFDVLPYQILATVVIDDVAAVLIDELDALLRARRRHQRILREPLRGLSRGEVAVEITPGRFVAGVAELRRQILNLVVLLGARRIESRDRKKMDRKSVV